jgi:hypothetical protein
MSQLFPKRANALARSSIAAALAFVGLASWVVLMLMRSSWLTKQDEFIEQPVQFSHLHHVSGDGIDCRYCHTSVENSSYAGIPPTRTCMNCHSQLWTNAPILEPIRASFRSDTRLDWIKVYDLPDFVYFNHQIHVNKGVGCSTCHGPVDKMPIVYQYPSLQMEWCLGCHRAPENFVRPKEEVFNMAYRQPSWDHPVTLKTGESFTSQLALGLTLKNKDHYNISDQRHMTSCSVCHR